MSADVICPYCGLKFNRNKVPFVPVGARRYAHQECHLLAESRKSQETKDYEALTNYIKELFHEPVLDARVCRQIKTFHETYKYTYSGMLKTLQWWYEIQHNTIEKANGGIGIIPWVYKDAEKYYYELYQIQERARQMDVAQIQLQVKEFNIEPPKIWVAPPRLFNMNDEENTDE